MTLRLLFLGMLLLGGSLARAQVPSDALPRLVRGIYEEAQRRESEGDLRGAELRYQKVLEMQPSWTNAIQDLGRVREARGDIDGAVEAYRRAPFEADAVEALAFLYLGQDLPEQAAPLFIQLRHLRPETPRFLPWEAAAISASDPVDAERVFREYLAKTEADLADPEIQRIALELVNRLHLEERERAEDLLETLVPRLEGVEMAPDADASARDALLKLRTHWDYARRARELLSSADQPLEPAQLEVLERATQAFAAGQLEEASALFERILAQSPANAATWAALSAVREAQGRIAEAEQAIVMAETLSPLNADYPARLGTLLATHYGGQRDVEAARAYRRALRRPGSDPGLWRSLAAVETGVRAAESLERFLSLEPEGTQADEARIELANHQRLPPALLEAPAAAERPDGVSEEAWFNLHLAYLYLLDARLLGAANPDYSELIDAATVTILKARAEAPDSVRVLNLEAQIRVERGEPADAIRLWEKSLARDPSQARVAVDLAQIYGAQGESDRRDALLARALSLDEPSTLLDEAVARSEAREWWLARTFLERYFAVAPPGSAGYVQATQLLEELNRRILAVYLISGGAVALALLLPLLLRWYRRTGTGLSELLATSPPAFHDVARICSAIRHEILKHNTTVLVTVADAIEAGDPEPARWAADKLFGAQGAVSRFRQEVADLELLGRVHGQRVNLRYRDPLFSALIEAFDRLARLEPELRGSAGRHLPAQLRDISEVLNDRGYRRLGAFVQSACLLPLDAVLFQDLYDEVCKEPAFAGKGGVRLVIQVAEEPVLLRIFRTDFRDILSNLYRNSLEITHETGGDRIGILVDLEDDPITGLERVVIRVADDGPRRISTAMIRGRYISRGLGLAVDLISRNGGSIHVEDENEWSKSVVVRLPRAEVGGGERG